MNEKLFRPQFNRMETSEKKALMESLAARYNMTFLGLQTFDRWGQNCTTGIFEKDEREFVFVPGDTVTLGWEQFAPLFWERNCYSHELQEYQRIAVLVSLNAIHSGLLPQYLERAKQDGRKYLLEHAERIEGAIL